MSRFIAFNKSKILTVFCLVAFLAFFSAFLPASVSANANKMIVVSLSHENLVAYEDGRVALQTPVTTGGPGTRTPVGTFQVLAKERNFVMKSPWSRGDWRWYPNSFVRYGLLFQGSGYFIHDAPWRSRFGVGSDSVFGRPGGNNTGTHGCVNVPSGAEARLYNWSSVGTTVAIQP